jgi:anti-sigma factor RsiW
MRDDHIGESAELYALGELDEMEAARVARHSRTCDECARRLGEAEEAVAAAIESAGVPAARPEALDLRIRFTPAPSRTHTPAWIAAVAAAFVIGLLPWGVTMTQHPAPSQSQDAVDAMLAGHFVHAPFAALRSGAPAAKVIYAREGGWIYVLAAAGNGELTVATQTKGVIATVASLEPSEKARAAFVRTPTRIDTVLLLDHGTPIASVRVVYTK